mmetsp:Transcript_14339/g.36647  ORF Transcript_14339/g.36647 Transcript_14339/m.36647 type:complete len:242 (-) Transcript_14339:1380-2105(-)
MDPHSSNGWRVSTPTLLRRVMSRTVEKSSTTTRERPTLRWLAGSSVNESSRRWNTHEIASSLASGASARYSWQQRHTCGREGEALTQWATTSPQSGRTSAVSVEISTSTTSTSFSSKPSLSRRSLGLLANSLRHTCLPSSRFSRQMSSLQPRRSSGLRPCARRCMNTMLETKFCAAMCTAGLGWSMDTTAAVMSVWMWGRASERASMHTSGRSTTEKPQRSMGMSVGMVTTETSKSHEGSM